MDYSTLPIFQNITPENILRMFHCFSMRQERFHSGEVICNYGAATQDVGILLSGAAELIRIDSNGNRTVLEQLETGGIFGEVVAFPELGNDCTSVVCTKDCGILYIEYRHIIRRCENACEHHSQLVHNVIGLLTEHNLRLSRRVEVLSRRSIRDKLLCYFSIQAAQHGNTFVLPFTLSTLADYISTDRSAMMRELKKLRDEKIVSVSGRQITLLN